MKKTIEISKDHKTGALTLFCPETKDTLQTTDDDMHDDIRKFGAKIESQDPENIDFNISNFFTVIMKN